MACGLSEAITSRLRVAQIAVAYVDVRLGDSLEHLCRRAGLVCYRDQHHLLLLHDPESRFVQDSTAGCQVGGQDVHDPAHLRVAVDVDPGGADTANRLVT